MEVTYFVLPTYAHISIPYLVMYATASVSFLAFHFIICIEK